MTKLFFNSVFFAVCLIITNCVDGQGLTEGQRFDNSRIKLQIDSVEEACSQMDENVLIFFQVDYMNLNAYDCKVVKTGEVLTAYKIVIKNSVINTSKIKGNVISSNKIINDNYYLLSLIIGSGGEKIKTIIQCLGKITSS